MELVGVGSGLVLGGRRRHGRVVVGRGFLRFHAPAAPGAGLHGRLRDRGVFPIPVADRRPTAPRPGPAPTPSRAGRGPAASRRRPPLARRVSPSGHPGTSQTPAPERPATGVVGEPGHRAGGGDLRHDALVRRASGGRRSQRRPSCCCRPAAGWTLRRRRREDDRRDAASRRVDRLGDVRGIVAFTTTDPFYLAPLVAAAWFVSAAHRVPGPASRSFRMFALAGVAAMVLRTSLVLLGTVDAGSVAYAALEGARLATLLVVFGTFNAVTDPFGVVRLAPRRFHEPALAAALALSIAPRTIAMAGRVREAQQLRGIGVSLARRCPRSPSRSWRPGWRTPSRSPNRWTPAATAAAGARATGRRPGRRHPRSSRRRRRAAPSRSWRRRGREPAACTLPRFPRRGRPPTHGWLIAVLRSRLLAAPRTGPAARNGVR